MPTRHFLSLLDFIKFHNTQTDIEISSFIQDNHDSFGNTVEDKNNILTGLEEVMAADGIIKDVEMIMYRFIKKTLLLSY